MIMRRDADDELCVPFGCPLASGNIYERMSDTTRRSTELRLESGATYQCPSLCDNSEMTGCTALRDGYSLAETRTDLDDVIRQLKPER